MVHNFEYLEEYHILSYSQIIPLFNTNPYTTISEKPQNKFFYISIFNNIDERIDIYLKKPKVFSGIKLNMINILPPLDGEE